MTHNNKQNLPQTQGTPVETAFREVHNYWRTTGKEGWTAVSKCHDLLYVRRLQVPVCPGLSFADKFRHVPVLT